MLYPIEIEGNEKEPELRIDYTRVSLNPALSNLFDLPPSFENEILSLIPTGELNLATPGLIAKDLAQHIPGLDLSPFDAFPQLLSSTDISSSQAKKGPALLPASAIILAEKSKNVAGLLHELEELLTQPVEKFPPAMRALLGQPILEAPDSKPVSEEDFAPAFLSPAQRQLLKSANSQPLTVCHGPPGTGKSFTISATALDQVARGHSVLIACRSEEAAAVIESKISEFIPRSQLVIRAGRKKHLRKLKSLLDQLLATNPTQTAPPGLPKISLRGPNKELARLRHKLSKRLSKEFKAASLFQIPPTGLWQKVRRWNHHQSLKNAPLLSKLVTDIIATQGNRLKLLDAFNAQTHQQHLHKHLKNLHSRDTLKRYREAIGRRIPASQERELLDLDLRALVNYLPIWVTTTDDIHRVLPLKPAVFDVVIIDEATQCDLASALPILYRGNRAFITGDPQQLRHLSFLSKDRLDNLGQKHALSATTREQYDFRKVSFLDRAISITSGSPALTFLDEHFRSLPQLISFSNQHFYHGNLHCMREVETLSQTRSEPALITNHISGTRDKEGINELEITAVLESLRNLLVQCDGQSPLSVGFLSPFRAQVDSFQKRLQEELTPTQQQRLLHDHHLIAGTAHSFQGAERDTMFISLAIDAQSPSAARRFLERPDVFNVSITRARHQIQLFTSLTAGELPVDSLLCAYLLHATDEKRTRKRTQPPHLPNDLLPRFESAGWNLIESEIEVAGMQVDLLFKKEERLLGIDLVGTPDSLGNVVSIEKTLLLKRAGLSLLPLSLAEWEVRKENFLTNVLSNQI
ncbi:MAG: DEAD/DEAH box helicase [Roseibacillus sp.]